MNDFFLYRKMLTPILITVVSYIFMAISVLAGLSLLVVGDTSLERFSGLGMCFVGPLIVRIYAEILIVTFRINDTLTDIRNLND